MGEAVTTRELFVEELRRARAAAKLTQAGLAARIGFSESLVSLVETDRRSPSRDFAIRCDEALGTGGLLARILAVSQHENALPWFRPWVAVEETATSIRWYEPMVVPGLLQTEAYARAVLACDGMLTSEEVDGQVAARMARRAVLDRPQPPHLTVVVDEFVLRRPVGGPQVMAEQAQHLLDLCATHPRVRVQVVPAAIGAYAGVGGGLVLATQPEGNDVGYLDTQLRGAVVERPADIERLRVRWEAIRSEALPIGRSLDMIKGVAHG